MFAVRYVLAFAGEMLVNRSGIGFAHVSASYSAQWKHPLWVCIRRDKFADWMQE